MVERLAVNRKVVGSSPTWGAHTAETPMVRVRASKTRCCRFESDPPCMNVKEMIELRRKRHDLRRQLAEVERELCGAETGHSFRGYCEWAHSGRECGHCGLRIKEMCHAVGCKCSFPHSTDPR